MKRKIDENRKVTLTLGQLKRLVKEARQSSVEIPDDAVKVISDRAIELLKSLGQSATVILYLLDPDGTAIGAPPSYSMYNAITNRVYDWVEHECPRDGNHDYTLRDLCTMIKNGEL